MKLSYVSFKIGIETCRAKRLQAFFTVLTTNQTSGYNDYTNKFSQNKKRRTAPKSYSEQERGYIQKRLKEEAAKCLAQYGIRRTTVDEIVKHVKIPKGTFYLFYRSKELLLFEVILEQHDWMEQKVYQSISTLDPETLSADKLTDTLLGFYKMSAEMSVLKLLNSDEIELLARRLPQETLAEHFGDDDAMMERIFAALPMKPGAAPKAFSTAFHFLYFSSLHKGEIGGENHEKALRILIYGLVTQLI